MEMMDTFSKTHQEHYYAQLIGLQCDMNLIMRADSYANVPLDDDLEHIARMLAEAQYEATRGRGIRAEGAASFNAYAGRYYSKLVTDINGALERRDVDLTLAHVRSGNKLSRRAKLTSHPRTTTTNPSTTSAVPNNTKPNSPTKSIAYLSRPSANDSSSKQYAERSG